MAESTLDIILRSKKTGTGEKEATSALKGLQNAAQELLGVNLTTAGALLAVGQGLKFVVEAASEAEVVDTRLTAVLNATGGAAGMSAQQLDILAQSMMYTTGMDDELIKSAEAVLLTFRNIAGEAFPRTMEAAADMGAVLGGDLKSNVEMLGRALENPAEGINLLQRSTKAFTEAERDMIIEMSNSGQVLEAQTFILDRLEQKFGGVSEAVGKTATGQWSLLKAEVGNLGETFGSKLLPPITEALSTLNLLLSWNDRITLALKQNAIEVTNNSQSYDDYRSRMEDAAKAAGYMVSAEGDLIKVQAGKMGTTSQVIEENYRLTESEWRVAQATSTVSGSASDAAKNLADASDESARMAENADRLATAQERFETAQRNWKEQVAKDVVASLEQAGIKGERLKEIKEGLDTAFGTNLAPMQEYKENIDNVVKEFAKTRDMDTFLTKVSDIAGKFSFLSEDVEKTAKELKKVNDELKEMKSKEIEVKIRYIISRTYEGSGGSDTSGGGGGCFVGETRVDTPKGLISIADIFPGDEVYTYENGKIITTKVVDKTVVTRNDLVSVNTEQGTLHCSPNHKFLTTRGWIEAQYLDWDDYVVTKDFLAGIVVIAPYMGEYTVYNLHIDHPAHNYFVEGHVVHNVKTMASGGILSNGQGAIVGENGPEWLRATNQGVEVIPQSRASAAPVGNTIYISIYGDYVDSRKNNQNLIDKLRSEL